MTSLTKDTHICLLNYGVKEDSWESLGLQEIKPVHPKKKSVLSIHWEDYAEAEAQIISPPDGKNWHIEKDPDVRKDWRQEEKGKTG